MLTRKKIWRNSAVVSGSNKPSDIFPAHEVEMLAFYHLLAGNIFRSAELSMNFLTSGQGLPIHYNTKQYLHLPLTFQKQLAHTPMNDNWSCDVVVKKSNVNNVLIGPCTI